MCQVLIPTEGYRLPEVFFYYDEEGRKYLTCRSHRTDGVNCHVVYYDGEYVHRYVSFFDDTDTLRPYAISFLVNCEEFWIVCYAPFDEEYIRTHNISEIAIVMMDGSEVISEWDCPMYPPPNPLFFL